MHNRAALFKKRVKKAIEEHGWNQEQDDFIVIGHQEEGLSVLEAAETLKEEIDIKHLIIYKELSRLGPLNLFDKEDYILSNEKLQEELFRLLLAT